MKPDYISVSLDTGLYAIQVLNEPISWLLYVTAPSTGKARDKEEAKGSGHVPTGFLKSFYQRAYAVLRSHLAERNNYPLLFTAVQLLWGGCGERRLPFRGVLWYNDPYGEGDCAFGQPADKGDRWDFAAVRQKANLRAGKEKKWSGM